MPGYDHSSITVRDLDSSLAYYRDGLGLGVTRIRDVAGRTVADLALPGERTWRLEEHRDVPRYPASARPCDPGFAHVCLYVDDAAAVTARLRAAGFGTRGEVVGITSGPHTGAEAAYTVDPDGFVVELYRPAGGTGGGPGTVTGFFHHGITVTDLDAALEFWTALGARLRERGTRSGRSVAALVGLLPESLDTAFLDLPGAPSSIEVFAYQGIERHPAIARDADPASSRLVLRTTDPAAVAAAVPGGGRPDPGHGPGALRVHDPDGYPVVLRPDR